MKTKEKQEVDHAREQAAAQLESIVEMVRALRVADDGEEREEAERMIQEDPLSVEVRSGWAGVGMALAPEEFQILLCTGGPAVRIIGELDEHGTPSRAWLEYQDWGTPWTEYFGFKAGAMSDLLEYCQQFYFAE